MKVEVFREFSGKFPKRSDSNGRRTPFPMHSSPTWYLLMSGKNTWCLDLSKHFVNLRLGPVCWKQQSRKIDAAWEDGGVTQLPTRPEVTAQDLFHMRRKKKILICLRHCIWVFCCEQHNWILIILPPPSPSLSPPFLPFFLPSLITNIKLGMLVRDKSGVWDWHIHTTIYKIDKQQGPTV